MFTGLVEDRATVAELRPEGDAHRLVVEVAETLAGGCEVGDSVALNGCCLTAVAVEGRRWSFQAGPETLAKTNLGRLAAGDPVNIERALPVAGRFGGHFVQGHVDGTGEVAAIDPGEWVTMWFRVPPALAELIVPKGSVAVDGVSLTPVEVGADRFSIALIPHTLAVTNLGARRVGDAVNIETDILGKYVQRLISSCTTPNDRPAPG